LLINSSILTFLLIFVGAYYLVLFFISLFVKNSDEESNEDFFFFIIIPAKNEEAVIERTLKNLLEIDYPKFRVLVVNDNSIDRTLNIINDLSRKNEKIIALNKPPGEKSGKGTVLNFAIKELLNGIKMGFLEPFNIDPEEISEEKTIIAVFDADAQVSKDTLKIVSRYFKDENLDALQTSIRISNRKTILAKMQDLEFLGFSRIIQKARSKFGSVGLGGNGQFTRLTSLLTIGESPWGDTLTEDFELGLKIHIKRFKNRIHRRNSC